MRNLSVQRLGEIAVIALLYVVFARIGQQFAIPPGNITPIWVPSGLMLALVILRGYAIWPGIFLGAFIGNVSAYFDASSLQTMAAAIFSGSANGLGDVLSAAGAVFLLERYSGSINPFAELRVFWRFLVFGALLGPAVSAVLGVGSLAVAGFVPTHDLPAAFLTWWMGDGIGALLIAPAILVFRFRPHESIKAGLLEFVAYALAVVGVSALSFLTVKADVLEPDPALLMIPLLMWSLTRLGLKTTFVTVLFFAVATVVATSQGAGPFARETQWLSLITMHIYFALVATSMFVIGSVVTEKQRLLTELAAVAEKDGLTEAFNRRYFDKALDAEIKRYKRIATPFSLIMIDVDNFKEVNDRLGHLVGDKVLNHIASCIRQELRGTDILARWGGEEFMVLLPSANAEGAMRFAERCRQRVADSDPAPPRGVTISLGVIEYKAGMDKALLLRSVDAALYRSKRKGRNMISLATPAAA